MTKLTTLNYIMINLSILLTVQLFVLAIVYNLNMCDQTTMI